MDPDIVTSQIRAALRTLRATVEACPEGLWRRRVGHSAFWALAYHGVFFAHLYLSPSEEAFEPFVREVAGREGFGRTDLDDWSTLTDDDVYSREDVIAYCDFVDEQTGRWVESKPFDQPSGFYWLEFTRGEAHLYNLRHIQHHAAQLADRLRQELDVGTRWIPSGR